MTLSRFLQSVNAAQYLRLTGNLTFIESLYANADDLKARMHWDA